MIGLGCVTGRFQPVHEQHLALFEIALAQCAHLVVAVTNPDSGMWRQDRASPHRHMASANPFTYFERIRLLEAATRGRGWADRTTIVPFDLTRPEFWPEYVPLSARQYVRAFSDWEREKARWLETRGYVVTLIEGNPSARLSASDIRAVMRRDDGCWDALVPAPTRGLLAEMLDSVPMRERV
jgi:nicotinamide-nucleotide adenylyltransferase